MEDLIVVGASFAGLACARSAARRGLRVLVMDRKARVGEPIHTTGILVKEAAQEWEVPPRLTRKIHGVRLYAPALGHLDLESPGYWFLATETAGLLRWFAREAQHAGARLLGRAPFLRAYRVSEGFVLGGYRLPCRSLVGADGPRSSVAECFGLGRNRRFLVGVEEEYVGLRGVDADRLHCFLDSALAPGYIAWVVPGVGNAVQVGLACRRPHRPDLAALRVKLGRLFDFSRAERIGRRGGLIPIGGPVRPEAAPGVTLIGDAAGLVSPLTAGGIHTALESGWQAAHAIADHLLDGGPEPGAVLARAQPSFRFKRLARAGFDCDPPNWLYDSLIGSRALRAVARLIYFHHRGLLGRAGWEALSAALREGAR